MFKNKILFLVLLFSLSLKSYARVESVFNSSATGTTSATVFVPHAVTGDTSATTGSSNSGVAEIRDLSWRIDSNVTTAFIGEYIGQKKFLITSATASAASVLWFTNTNSDIAVGEFIIFFDDSTATYYLRRVSASTTTSITLYTSIAVTTTTRDALWSTLDVVSKPVGGATTTTTLSSGSGHSLWFPASVPTALVIDGNTTSCAISISGARGDRQ